MYRTNLFTLLVSLLFAVMANSAAIFYRDNACTACLAMIEQAVKIPALLECSTSDDDKKTIMHEQVCFNLTATPLFNFCESYVDAWSPQLYTYLETVSDDPQNVCSQPQFKAC